MEVGTMKNVIEVKDLSFSYGTQAVLNEVNFEVQAGQIVGLIGENGAGKTTLLKILLGLLKPKTAKVTVMGQVPAGNGVIEAMPQGDLKLLGVTVRKMLMEAALQYAHPISVDQVLTELGMKKIAKQRLTQLSGGQLRQVMFAMTLVGNTDLIFLDEPTVGMDVNTRQLFWLRINQLKKLGKTILITSHYLEEIQQVADQLLILKNGKIKFNGSLNELQNQYLATKISFKTDLTMTVFEKIAHVTNVVQINGEVQLTSDDGDATLRALVPVLANLHQIEIVRQSLENIFMDLMQGDQQS
jgi:ABC-2 type transport system ATP-binding protein